MDIYAWKDHILEELHKGIIRPEDNEKLIQMAREQENPMRKEIADAILREESSDLYYNIWIYSFSLAIYPNPMVLKNLIMIIRTSYDLDYKQKYFLFQQINSIIFKYPECNTDDITRLEWGLLEDILKSCKQTLSLKLDKIPVSERNKGISVVLVEQYLTEEHGPTKTALDRCYVLKKMFGQDVMLINTAELLSLSNYVYFEDASIGNYYEELSERDSVSWKGEKFRFYQCPQTMPSDDGILELVSFVKTIKPASIVLVGGTSLVAGLLNELVPVITVGTLLSRMAMTLSKYQIISRNMLSEAKAFLEFMGKDEDHIIPGRFTYALKEQTHQITRKTLGIDENAFALAVVGGRLTDEITDDFLCMLEQCIDEAPETKEIVVGIIGVCKGLESRLERHKKLIGKVVSTGFVTDILSVIEHFDLYINPIRRGGGTSVIEAMYKKIPAITVNYGDVAEIVGSEFSCNDYEEMKAIILQYLTDEAFYETKSKKAEKVASEYLDSSKEFARIMEEYYKKQEIEITKKPLLSVIVPCYNVEKYVERCLESIVNQTFGIENMDVILVNDASTDQTRSILQKYEDLYPKNIRVMDLENNGGPGRARNIGIKEAKADCITFVDSDDWISEDMYTDLYQNGIEKGCDLAICGYDRPDRYGDDSILKQGDTGIINVVEDEVRKKFLREYRTNIFPVNKIYRKSLFTDYHLAYPEGIFYEDNYLGFLILLVCQKVYITETNYYHWFVDPTSITRLNKRPEDRLTSQNLLLEKVKQMQLYDRFRYEVDFNYVDKAFIEMIAIFMQYGMFSVENVEHLKQMVKEHVPDIEQNPYCLGKEEIIKMMIFDEGFSLITEPVTETALNKILDFAKRITENNKR